MPYLLDGNNLIGTVRRTSRPTDEDRSALIAEIAERLRNTRARASIVFDGPGGRPSALGRLTVRCAAGGNADEDIVAEIRRSRSPGEIVVVTADRELARRARDAGAKVSTPGDFFARFGLPERTDGEDRRGSGPVNVEEWARYFADERNRE